MPPSNSSKNILRESSLIRLYTVLILSFCYFLIQLVVSHVAHSLILQVDAYHMLYNILSLSCTIITTKMCRKGSNVMNTFGWTRIDVCGAVASLCFLAALCFSVMVEALQAMFHASHHEKMHYEEYVGAVGLLGLVINAVTCVIIGGYSYQQQGFLGSHKDGENIVISPSARRGPAKDPRIRRPGPVDAFRDFFGCVLVIICAAVVHFGKDYKLVDFVDPSVTILEVVILGCLSYKYAREAGYILLLTIPDHINVQTLLNELHESFPEICDIHEFHVWQLTPARIIASAHLVLQDTKDCWIIQNNVTDFLQSKGISHVTLQPEFMEIHNAGASPATLKRRQCFLPCGQTEDCHEKKCCAKEDDTLLSLLTPCDGHGLGHSHRSQSLQSFRPKDSPSIKHTKSDQELSKDKIPPIASVEDYESSDDDDEQVMKPMI